MRLSCRKEDADASWMSHSVFEADLRGKETLERWSRRPSSAQALALRCRIVLACAEGLSCTAVASLPVTLQTVGKWRSRFLAQRLDGLLDEPRPGAPRKISDAAVERVLTLTLETQPREATHWSTRSMAKRCGVSQSAVSHIWRAFALQPHRAEAFLLSKEPLFMVKKFPFATMRQGVQSP